MPINNVVNVIGMPPLKVVPTWSPNNYNQICEACSRSTDRKQCERLPPMHQEVIGAPDEAVQPSMYFGTGLVTEFGFANAVGNTFKQGSLSALRTFGEAWGLMSASHAVCSSK